MNNGREYVVQNQPKRIAEALNKMGDTGVAASGGFTSIADGRKVVAIAGTRVQLASTTPCKRVTITAETDNTGVVVVGGPGVIASLATRVGIPLSAGDVYWEDVTDLSLIWLDATVSGDGVTFVYTD